MTEKEMLETEAKFIIERMEAKTGKKYTEKEIIEIMGCGYEFMGVIDDRIEVAEDSLYLYIADKLSMDSEMPALNKAQIEKVFEAQVQFLQLRGFIPED